MTPSFAPVATNPQIFTWDWLAYLINRPWWITKYANAWIICLARCVFYRCVNIFSPVPRFMRIVHFTSHSLTFGLFSKSKILFLFTFDLLILCAQFKFLRLFLRPATWLLYFTIIQFFIFGSRFEFAVRSSWLPLFLFSLYIVPLTLIGVVDSIQLTRKPTF